jgi:hypothetical protein
MEADPAELVAAATAAARSARRAVSIALLAVAVAAVVLAIDQSIKRAIVEQAEQARRIFVEFQHTVMEAASGTETAGAGAAASSAGPDIADGVVYAPGTSPAAHPDEGGASLPAGRHAGRPPGGPGGDE